MKKAEFTIEGMNCGHCVMAVKKELSKIENLIIEDVQIGKAVVIYDETSTNINAIISAIDAAGFTVV
jgi:copper chaperone